MKIKDADGTMFEVGDIKPCPFCGSQDHIRIAGRKSYDELCAEHGSALLCIECKACDVRMTDYSIPGNNYDFGMGRMVARWNRRCKNAAE